MTTINGSISFTRFFDSVLSEIEFGKVEQGINMLSGMLDAVHMWTSQMVQARTDLRRHMLHQMLMADPIYAKADDAPGDYSGLMNVVSGHTDAEPNCGSARRLFAATSNLPIVRALRQRRLTAWQKLDRAVHDNLRIAIIGTIADFPVVTAACAGHAHVTIIEASGTATQGLDAMPAEHFDLIYAPELLDTANANSLADLFAKIRSGLTPTGVVLVSALHAGHPGSGWRRACLRWEPALHEQAELRLAAATAGLVAQTYNDTGDCIIWAELRPARSSSALGSENHGN